MRSMVRTLLRSLALTIWLALVALSPTAAHAVEPDEILRDAALETRARAISGHLRCLVCQNQSIDDSNAALAKDLRLLVRQRLTAGDSDVQVRDYVVQRYGEFVLLRPPLSQRTLLLWVMPLLLLALTALAVRRGLRSSLTVKGADPGLTADEQARLAAILKRDG